jgi:hypothetical protein
MWDAYKQSCPRLDGVKHHSRISSMNSVGRLAPHSRIPFLQRDYAPV